MDSQYNKAVDLQYNKLMVTQIFKVGSGFTL